MSFKCQGFSKKQGVPVCFPPLVQVLIRARVCPDFAPGHHGESSSMSRSSHRSVREEGGHRERGKERRGRSRSHSRERDGRSGKSVRYVRKEDKTKKKRYVELLRVYLLVQGFSTPSQSILGFVPYPLHVCDVCRMKYVAKEHKLCYCVMSCYGTPPYYSL